MAVSKSEGIVGSREGPHPTAFCAWLVLVGLKSLFPPLSVKCRDCLPSAQDLLPVFLFPWPEILVLAPFFSVHDLFLKDLEEKAADCYSQDFCGECDYKAMQRRGEFRSSLYCLKLVPAWSRRDLTPVCLFRCLMVSYKWCTFKAVVWLLMKAIQQKCRHQVLNHRMVNELLVPWVKPEHRRATAIQWGRSFVFARVINPKTCSNAS